MTLKSLVKTMATGTIPLLIALAVTQVAAADDSSSSDLEQEIDNLNDTLNVPTNNHPGQPGLHPVSSISVQNLNFQQCYPYPQCQPGTSWTRDTVYSHHVTWYTYGYRTPGAAVISGDPMTFSANSFGAFGQCFAAQSILGRTLSLTGWVATSNVFYGYAGLWLRLDDASGNAIYLDNMNGRGMYGSNGYTQLATQVKVPFNTARICVGGLSTGTGSAYFDDFAVRWN
jgi:hypothetical protein